MTTRPAPGSLPVETWVPLHTESTPVKRKVKVPELRQRKSPRSGAPGWGRRWHSAGHVGSGACARRRASPGLYMIGLMVAQRALGSVQRPNGINAEVVESDLLAA